MASHKTTRKPKQPKPRKPIKRQTRHFQLRVGQEYPVDAHVAEILNYKKSKREEVTAIRDGVRLLWALENNDLNVLFELFPHMKSQFGGGNGAGGLDDIAAKLELLLAQKTTGGYLMQSAAEPTVKTTGKLLGGKAPALPIFNDDPDEPTVLIRANIDTDSSNNFVSAMRGMQ